MHWPSRSVLSVVNLKVRPASAPACLFCVCSSSGVASQLGALSADVFAVTCHDVQTLPFWWCRIPNADVLICCRGCCWRLWLAWPAMQPSGRSWPLSKLRTSQQPAKQLLVVAIASSGSRISGISGASGLRPRRTLAGSARLLGRLWRLQSSGRKSGNAAGCLPAPATAVVTNGTAVTGLMGQQSVAAEETVSGATTAAAGMTVAAGTGTMNAAAGTETAETGLGTTIETVVGTAGTNGTGGSMTGVDAANGVSGTIGAAAETTGMAGVAAAAGGKQTAAAGGTQPHRCGNRMMQMAVGVPHLPAQAAATPAALPYGTGGTLAPSLHPAPGRRLMPAVAAAAAEQELQGAALLGCRHGAVAAVPAPAAAGAVAQQARQTCRLSRGRVVPHRPGVPEGQQQVRVASCRASAV